MFHSPDHTERLHSSIANAMIDQRYTDRTAFIRGKICTEFYAIPKMVWLDLNLFFREVTTYLRSFHPTSARHKGKVRGVRFDTELTRETDNAVDRPNRFFLAFLVAMGDGATFEPFQWNAVLVLFKAYGTRTTAILCLPSVPVVIGR